MSNHALIPEVRHRNAQALAAAIGLLDLDQAAQLLDMPIMITASEDDIEADALAKDVFALLSRTVTRVSRMESEVEYEAELIIGEAAPRTKSRHMFVNLDQNGFVISEERVSNCKVADFPPILRRLVACYVCAAALKVALGERLKFTLALPFTLEFSALGIDLASLTREIDIGKACLAGAGAIGNGLIWALQGVSIRGELHIVDPDQVDRSNLQRQILFEEEDIGRNKCEQLVSKAQRSFPELRLIPRYGRLQELEERSDGAWLPTLIVAVDSRRARRNLQNELPGEVFDASTTGIEEVIIHYHRQPTEDACLACIYSENEVEQKHEAHIAEALGVTVEMVQQLAITEDAAELISKKYFEVFPDPSQIIGTPYDSLYHSLCSEDMLKAGTDKEEALTPFAFVSALAGVALGLEIIRRSSNGRHDGAFNYWRISPWHPPLGRLRRQAPRLETCSFCSCEVKRSVLQSLWA